MSLTELFERRKCFLKPGTNISDFLEFLGVPLVRLEEIDHRDIEFLPGVLNKGLSLSYRDFGTKPEASQFRYRASLRFENGKVELFYGRGASEKEAAIAGLFNYWEINYHKSNCYSKEDIDWMIERDRLVRKEFEKNMAGVELYPFPELEFFEDFGDAGMDNADEVLAAA